MTGFLDRLKRGADKAAFQTDRLRRITSVRSETRTLRSEINRNRKALGVKALELFDAGVLTQPELLGICEQIASLRRQIEEKEAEIEAIRHEEFPEELEAALYGHICPHCRIRLPDEARFCPRCGGPAEDVPPPTLPEMHTGLVCQNCGASLVESAVFCPNCGTEVKVSAPAPARVCRNCGTKIVEDVVFCPECGTQVEAPEPAPITEGKVEAKEDLQEIPGPVNEEDPAAERTDDETKLRQ